MWKKALFLIISVLFINSVSAQKTARRIELTGTVQDVYSGPIANAIIMIDGKKTNSVTDSKGKYKVRIKPGASTIGVFTFGNGTFEELINGRNHIDFKFSSVASYQLDSRSKAGEQGVNTGYGQVKKKNLTTDVTRIDGEDQKYASYSSITEMIMRESSGVRITGGDLVIQGSQNFNGYVHPLIVLDGVYMNQLPDIPPATVKSIEVLKGTSAAVYGSRGFGGAVIIKTKLKNN
jgi:TonB-dependent SusC/RagA subfamily outer membrane receptor